MNSAMTPKSDTPNDILGSHVLVPDMSNFKEQNQRLSYVSSNISITIDSTSL